MEKKVWKFFKKVHSKHMQNILKELGNFEFELIIFSEKIIFNEEVEVN